MGNSSYSLKNDIYLIEKEKETKMTVAVGAICEGGKYIVVAADKMLVFTSPMNIQFEPPDLCKINPITDTIAIAWAGWIPNNEVIISKTKASISANLQQLPTISKVVETVKSILTEELNTLIEQAILLPSLGAKFERYQQLIKDSPFSLHLFKISQDISQIQQQYKSEFIIAGVENGMAHLFGVTMPAILTSADSWGFHAIGVGVAHASASLVAQKYSKAFSLQDCLKAVYKAKKAGEIAPNVGQTTDMIVITDKIYQLTKEDIKTIENPAQITDIEELCKKWLPTKFAQK
jgi:20S proteasome alpha/beta subunit